jgi:hypothetical protein
MQSTVWKKKVHVGVHTMVVVALVPEDICMGLTRTRKTMLTTKSSYMMHGAGEGSLRLVDQYRLSRVGCLVPERRLSQSAISLVDLIKRIVVFWTVALAQEIVVAVNLVAKEVSS